MKSYYQHLKSTKEFGEKENIIKKTEVKTGVRSLGNLEILEGLVEGDKIIDFQTGDMSQKEILEMYNES